MKSPICACAVALILFALACPPIASADSAPIFILRQTPSGYDIETVHLEPGKSITIDRSTHPGFIEIILPVGPGGSGSVAKTTETRSATAAFDGRTVRCDIRAADGTTHPLPPRELDDLRNYDTHVSVTGADGSRAAFVIRNYATADIDRTGPVMDMFRGLVPMNSGDYSIFLNTASNQRAYQLTGEIPVTFSGKYLFVEAALPDGRTGLFAVDIGASVNLLTESFLPPDAELSELFMTEYTSGESRKLKYTPGGGTGTVETIVGHTTLASLKMGDLTYRDVGFDVIKSIPELHGRTVDGIIGLDLLNAARYLTLVYKSPGDGDSRIVISDTPPAGTPDITLPFVSIRELMYIRGQVAGRDVSFILDSGAPDCMLTSKSAGALNLSLGGAKDVTFQGGGGQQTAGQSGTLPAISLAGKQFTDIPCVIGELFPLSTLGKGQYGGLIGNSFFSRFNAVTLDFDAHELRLTM